MNNQKQMESPTMFSHALSMRSLAALLMLGTWMLTAHPSLAENKAAPKQRWVEVRAKSREDRSALANLGLVIEEVRSDSVWGFADQSTLEKITASQPKTLLGSFDASVARGGHETGFDFPAADARYHNYAELTAELQAIVAKHASVVTLSSIGKTTLGKDIWAVHINTDAQALQTGQSEKPGAIFMGNHHAREHLSAEIPLMLIDYLLTHRKDTRIQALVESRDLWFVPMVNPDGVEYDIASGSYRMWRKNRRNNGDGTYGVDLNRNYGYKWGTGGSSDDTSSDIYKGTEPFSEPETQVIRDFVSAHRNNTRVLLTFHTFSELILYPWGHTFDGIGKAEDRQVFESMAKTMSQWNGYTPQQSSDLYIASGDTTDWAYGELGIFAFTFELSPKSMWNGGFYPGARIIDQVFEANLKPCLYMIELADNPHRAITGGTEVSAVAGAAANVGALPEATFSQLHPMPKGR